MTKNIALFLATFIAGAAIAFAARTALHKPFSAPTARAEAAAYAPMVDNTATTSPTAPATLSAPAAATPAPAADPHAGHAAASAQAAPAPVAALKTVNTVCAICGMDVNPAIPPATYQGKLIGFGCRTCPAKFAKEPDRYGPSALRNEVVEEK